MRQGRRTPLTPIFDRPKVIGAINAGATPGEPAPPTATLIGSVPLDSGGDVLIRAMAKSGSTIYLPGVGPGSSFARSIFAVDVSDPTTPTFTRTDFPDTQAAHLNYNASPVVVGSYLYVLDQGVAGPSGRGIRAFDISTPSAPAYAGASAEPVWSITSMTYHAPYIYVAALSAPESSTYKIFVYSLGDPTTPTLELEETVTGPGSSGANPRGDVMVINGDLFVFWGGSTNLTGQLSAYDISAPTTSIPFISALTGLGGSSNLGVFAQGNYVVSNGYATPGGQGFRVVDVSDPASMFVAGTLAWTTSVDMVSIGSYAVSPISNSLTFVNLTDPTNPTTYAPASPPTVRSAGTTGDTLFDSPHLFITDVSGDTLEVVQIS